MVGRAPCGLCRFVRQSQSSRGTARSSAAGSLGLGSPSGLSCLPAAERCGPSTATALVRRVERTNGNTARCRQLTSISNFEAESDAMAASPVKAPPATLEFFDLENVKLNGSNFWASAHVPLRNGSVQSDEEEDPGQRTVELRRKFHSGRYLNIRQIPRDVTEKVSYGPFSGPQIADSYV